MFVIRAILSRIRDNANMLLIWFSYTRLTMARQPISASLLHKQQQAIRLAKEYRRKYGNPVDKLSDILRQVVDDEETWRTIVDEPYGRQANQADTGGE